MRAELLVMTCIALAIGACQPLDSASTSKPPSANSTLSPLSTPASSGPAGTESTAASAGSSSTDVPLVLMPSDVLGPFPVTRVVDGDTVRILIDGEDFSVRLIGIDTPETVAPNRPIECAGPEASVYAEQLMSGERVFLELDDSQGTFDRYERVLAYVWLSEDIQVNLEMLRAGLAEEYTYDDPYKYQDLFRKAEQDARAELLGLWGQIC